MPMYRNMYEIECGPVTSQELANLIRSGVVYGSRPVRKAESPEWTLAKDLPQFSEIQKAGTAGRVVMLILAPLIVYAVFKWLS